MGLIQKKLRGRRLAIAASTAIVLVIAGCANLGYYFQSVGGQWQLWNREQPIASLLDDPDIAPPLKQKLQAVVEIRDFASDELGLPDNGSYRYYADLERPFVVWNVFATPELSIEPIEWCFPVAGCVNYRGYFSKEAAQQFAAELQQKGYDVFVAGVPAYSTLGWLNDPVLNTFINHPVPEIARLLFHELSHQVVYVPGDTTFNESFAVAVEQEGLRRWFAGHGTAAQNAEHERLQSKKKDFVALILQYRGLLEEIFSSKKSPTEQRAAKARALDALQGEYQQLKSAWGGFKGFDWWFAQRPGNAQLVSVATYTQLVPAFQRLLAREGGDLKDFYAAVKDIGALEPEARLAHLNGLTETRASLTP